MVEIGSYSITTGILSFMIVVGNLLFAYVIFRVISSWSQKRRKVKLLCKERQKFFYWLGDLFHNFGSDGKYGSGELKLSKEDTRKIQKLFNNIKHLGKRGWSSSVVNQSDLTILTESFSFDESLTLEIFKHFDSLDDIDREIFIMQLLIFRAKQLLPIYTNNHYEFKDMESKSINEILNFEWL